MKKVLLLLLTFCIATSIRAQQDSQFTQYMFNNLHINPAYAGLKGDYYIQSFYRSQWQGIKGAPKTLSIAADGSFYQGKVGLGLLVANDEIGAQSNLSAYANYAYRLFFDDDNTSSLSFGVAGGMMQLGIDGNKLSAITPGDLAIPNASQTRVYPDARFGVFYNNSEHFFVGISATNILAKYMSNRNNDDLLVPIPQPHVYLTGGALFPLGDDLDIKPSILIKDDFKGPVAVDLNTLFLIKQTIWIGGFYRSSFKIHNNNLQSDLPISTSIGLITELFATKDLRVGYSFDYSLNKLRNYNAGSHEISVGLYLNRKDYAKIRQTRCYDF